MLLRRILRRGSLLACVSAVIIALAIPAHAGEIRNGRLAFASFRDGHLDVFTMQPDGGGVRDVTGDPQPDFFPSWSPDGSRIVYVSLHVATSPLSQLFVVHAAGGRETQLTHLTAGGPGNPSWSPDGSEIAFHVSYGGALDDEVFTIHADGSHLVQLTDNAANDSDAVWAPDGGRLAFVRDARVETMQPDGTGVRPVTPAGLLAFDPSWSPDGSRIAFIGRDATSTQYDLFTIATDGSDLRLLRDTPRDELEPSWSPNGRRIAYVLVRHHYESDTEDHLICTMRPDGSHRRVLSSDDTTLDDAPDWRF
jgi:Tol biopolymer transport system component